MWIAYRFCGLYTQIHIHYFPGLLLHSFKWISFPWKYTDIVPAKWLYEPTKTFIAFSIKIKTKPTNKKRRTHSHRKKRIFLLYFAYVLAFAFYYYPHWVSRSFQTFSMVQHTNQFEYLSLQIHLWRVCVASRECMTDVDEQPTLSIHPTLNERLT